MAVAWQTLEEAALTLGISSRTLHRRISKGEVQTRMENGRREVQVVIADQSAGRNVTATADMTDKAEDSVGQRRSSTFRTSDTYDTDTTFAAGAVAGRPDTSDDVRQTADNDPHAIVALHEDRVRRTDLAILAYQQSVTTAAGEARRANVRSRIAWSIASTSVIALFIATVWTTHSLTKAQAETSRLNDAVRQLTGTTADKTKEADDLRKQAETAQITAANVQGQLAAEKNHVESIKGQLKDLLQAQQVLQAHLLGENAQSASSHALADSVGRVSASSQPSAMPISAPATRPVSATNPLINR